MSSETPAASERKPPGRAEGYALLEASAAADSVRVALGPQTEAARVLASFVMRARRLTRSIFRLLDAGEELEAEILSRALLETVVTLGWLAADLDRRLPRWRLSGARKRVEWDDAYAKTAAGERLLDPGDRTRMDAIIAEAKAAGLTGMPDLRQRCAEISIDPTLHTLVYRLGSHGATHPSPYALERFIAEVTPEGALIRADAPGARLEHPYVFPALFLAMALFIATRSRYPFPWRPEDLLTPWRSLRSAVRAHAAELEDEELSAGSGPA